MASQVYTKDTIASALEATPGWQFGDGLIYREYLTDGWSTTLMLLNLIGYLCESADHHPDLMVTWGKVVVSLSTHSAGGVTDSDLELAGRIDEVALWAPGTGSALRGIQRPFVRGV